MEQVNAKQFRFILLVFASLFLGFPLSSCSKGKRSGTPAFNKTYQAQVDALPLGIESMVQEQFLDFPVYEYLSNLKVSLRKNSNIALPTKNLSIQILYYNGSEILDSQTFPLTDDEVTSCLDQSSVNCLLSARLLKMYWRNVTCKLQVAIVSASSSVALSNMRDLQWGRCESLISRSGGPVMLPDLQIATNSLSIADVALPDAPIGIEKEKNIQVVLKNIGTATTRGERFKVVALGFNRVGNLIWSSMHEVEQIMAPTAKVGIDFLNMKQWQWHELCRVNVIVDSAFSVDESAKTNNEKNFSAGACETPASYLAGDRIDLVPYLNIVDDAKGMMAEISIYNIGKLPLDESFLPVDFVLSGLDEKGLLQFFIQRGLVETLSGYGGVATKEFYLPRNSSACRYVINIDPGRRLRESNDSNNQVEINRCH